MIKRLLKKSWLALIAVLLLSITIPAVSAFEGHKVDIRAEVTIPATKVARLATAEEICYAKRYLAANIPSNPNPTTVTAWDYIPAKTCVVWAMTLFVINPLDYEMEDVTVYDEFNEHVAVVKASVSRGTADIVEDNGIYYVDEWQVGDLAPGESACLNLIVWTECEENGGCDGGDNDDDQCHHDWDWDNGDWNCGWDWHDLWTDCGWLRDRDAWEWNSCDWDNCEGGGDYKWFACETGGGNDNDDNHNGDHHNDGGCDEGDDNGCDNECDQQFTAAGDYNLNESGICMEWYYWQDGENFQGSYTGGPFLTVTVYEDECPGTTTTTCPPSTTTTTCTPGSGGDNPGVGGCNDGNNNNGNNGNNGNNNNENNNNGNNNNGGCSP